MCFVLLTFSVAPATTQPRPILGDPGRDTAQTMQARKLLADDPALRNANIGVIVTDRVAVLWGPIASAELGFQAEICLRRMVELAEVRNELIVSESLEAIRVPLKIDLPPLYLPPAPSKLPRLNDRPVLGAPGVLMGQEKVEVKSPSVPTSQMKAAKVEVKVLPDPPAVTEPDLGAAVRGFLQTKSAFRAIVFEIKDRRVFLRTDGPDADALHDAARGIARLPGVEGVILMDKSSKPE